MTRKLLAEFFGTLILVLVAVGAAVAGGTDGAGLVAVALAFGLTLMALAYAFGPVSGTHVNPAVTLAVLLAKRMDARTAAGYIAAQVAGAIVGAFALWLLVETGGVTDQTGGLGTNAYDNGAINLWGALLLEFLLTAVFVGVILLVTDERMTTPFAGLAIGVALTAVHLIGIPLTGTSVNPARSLGPALFAGGDALSQVWLFIVAPLAGAVGAWAVWAVTRPAESTS